MVVADKLMLDADGRDRHTPPAELGLNVTATGLDLGVLFERLLDAVVIAKLTTGRIVSWNPAAERLFGWTAGEAIGQSIEMLMPEPITHVHRAGMERYLRTGHGLIMDAASPVEMPARTKNDTQIRIELSLSELRNSRGERFALAVIRDAMHRKRLELTHLELVQARLARSEAEAELALRDELLDAFSTELARVTDSAQVRHVNALLEEYGRLRHGELPFRAVETELVDVVHAAVDAARRVGGGRRVLVFAPPTVTAIFDPQRTRQLLDYLLADAVACTGHGSNLEIHLVQPSPQVAQLRLLAPGVPEQPNALLASQVARAMLQRQSGSLALNRTPDGGFEAVLTLPGRPHPARRKPGRIRSRRERVSLP